MQANALTRGGVSVQFPLVVTYPPSPFQSWNIRDFGDLTTSAEILAKPIFQLACASGCVDRAASVLSRGTERRM